MKTLLVIAASMLALASATSAIARPGNGPGGRGGFAFNQNNVAAWQLMSAEERSAHQQKMWAASNVTECQTMQSEFRTNMQERAKAKGQTLPTPRRDACSMMAARGMFK